MDERTPPLPEVFSESLSLGDLPKLHSAGQRRFLGFERSPGLQRSHMQQRVLDLPQCRVLSDVSIEPLSRVEKGQFSGGLYQRGRFLDELALARGFGQQRTLAVAPGRGADSQSGAQRFRRAWFGGYIFNHFGHFLLEGLARVQSSTLIESDAPIIFLNPSRTELKSYMQDMFAAAGIDPGRIVLCNEQTHVEELHCLEASFEIRGVVRPGAYEATHTNIARRTPTYGERNPAPIVYLSRTRLQRHREIGGENIFEDWIARRHGAVVAHPQFMSVAEQISLLTEAKVIVACEGSALHLPAILGGRKNLVILAPQQMNVNYFLCDELMDGDSIYINASSDPDARPNAGWTLDPSKTMILAEQALEQFT